MRPIEALQLPKQGIMRSMTDYEHRGSAGDMEP
jgi:hypothetical protein